MHRDVPKCEQSAVLMLLFDVHNLQWQCALFKDTLCLCDSPVKTTQLTEHGIQCGNAKKVQLSLSLESSE